MNYNQPIQSVIISSSDPNGFFINALRIDTTNSVPEPTTTLLGACGLALVFIGRKRWMRS
jgi:hypothetical protein